ncbi:hypothetical protein R7127_25435 [Vibrio sp. 1159]|uniref:hypothetical protein n=1 Tax=Vibrio sp. 1159 TaxID=3074545 RepID=UPI00296478DC|nr:hypothetical protein [Vibrio sp. 1159]MDW2323608.1 hypothetical protein [Vibrio sp. 1159]
MLKNVRLQDKLFNQRRKAQKLERGHAAQTLSPSMLQQAIKKGDIPSHFSVLLGSKSNGQPFEIEDLKGFDKARKSLDKKWKSDKGAPLNQLIAASRPVDVQRANTEIKVARLYKVRGDLLHFNVTASGKHGEGSYQVRVRLENWSSELTKVQRSWISAVKRICLGNVSIDCQCGRYQYWYRYVATAGGFALRTHEKDFPKIRNPKLTGCCCKHQLKALGALKSPTVQAQLAKHLQTQAESTGFSSDKDKFLSKDDRERLERAKPRKIDQSEAEKFIKKQEQAMKTFKRQLKDASYLKKLEKEAAALRAKLKSVSREAARAEKDELKAQLRLELDRAKMYGKSKTDAIKVFAFVKKLKIKDVQNLAKGL